MATTQKERNAHKIMRRGTRACRECRRRKIRCIYDEGRHDVCQECTTHNRQCIKQGLVRSDLSGQSSRSVKVSVSRLESAIEKLTREKANIGRMQEHLMSDGKMGTFNHRSIDTLFFEQQLKKSSPIFSLFDNDIIKKTGVTEAYNTELSSALTFSNPNLCDREKLLSTITNVPNILDVLEFASDWWISWREQHFALRATVGSESLKNFVLSKISDDDCLNVSVGLLSIAVALGQLRVGIDDRAFNLPVPAEQVMNSILAAIDQVICDSSTYRHDPNIILLYIMRAKQHMEHNQLRKAWARIRQAIHCAQGMNFGSVSADDSTLTTAQAEQQRFIASIFEIDHLISMILGFPRAKDINFSDARAFGVLLNPAINDEALKMRALRRIISVMAGHINDRNASGDTVDELTEGSQQTLELAASQMPPGWWNMLEQPMSGSAQYRYESLMVQLWFWTVQSYLNMPYLIDPRNTPAGIKFRSLCLNGTRNLLRTFTYLRSEPSVAVYMCNCDDFSGLLGACILLVGILQDAASTDREPSNNLLSPARSSAMDVDANLALIEDLKDIYRYRINEQGGGIAKQGLQVVEELTSYIYGDEDTTTTLDQTEQVLPGLGIDVDKRQKTIMLPYFGTINIELTKKITKRNTQNGGWNRLPTPPHSYNDGPYATDPSMTLTQTEFFHANALNMSNGTNDIWSLPSEFVMDNSGARYSPESETCLPYTDGSVGTAVDMTIPPPISWDVWETYMVDEELSKCWNPDLRCTVDESLGCYASYG